MVVMVSLFKYGDQVSTNLQLAAEFRSQCLDPVAIDRAGAAAEGVIASIMASIKSRWTHVLQGQEISWRRWATVIAKLNRNVHEAEIARGPPASLVGHFNLVGDSTQDQVVRVQRNVQMTKSIIRAVRQKVDALQMNFDVVQTDLASIKDILQSHLDVAEGLGDDVAIATDTSELVIALSRIPNVPNSDH